MRKIPFALILACGLASGSAFAATQGTVTINGEVVAETCTIVSGDEAKTVTLATVSTTAFTAANQTVAKQSFTIGLENCESGANVYAAFSAPVADIDVGTHTLINKAAAGATNVNIILLEQNEGQILLGDTSYPPSTQPVATADGAVTLEYSAAYYSTDATVTPGLVTAVANYVIAYQ